MQEPDSTRFPRCLHCMSRDSVGCGSACCPACAQNTDSRQPLSISRKLTRCCHGVVILLSCRCLADSWPLQFRNSFRWLVTIAAMGTALPGMVSIRQDRAAGGAPRNDQRPVTARTQRVRTHSAGRGHGRARGTGPGGGPAVVPRSVSCCEPAMGSGFLPIRCEIDHISCCYKSARCRYEPGPGTFAQHRCTAPCVVAIR
jgi:hypothetical protein